MSASRPRRIRIAITLAYMAISVSVQADSRVQVEASLTPRTIGVDETTQLTIRASGSGFGGVGLQPTFQLENLEVVAGPFESQQFQFTNGRASRSRSLTWELKPREVGQAAVRKIQVKVDDETMSLPDQELTVQTQPTRRAPQNPAPGFGFPDPFAQLFGHAPSTNLPLPQSEGSPRVFLRADVRPSDPYVGQQTTYTLYLFTQTSIGGINPESLPDFHGFWVQEIPQPDPPISTTVELEGRSYRKVVLIQRALFPLSPGRQAIDAARTELQIQIPGSSPFGGLFPQIQRVERESNRLAVRVRPLPPAPSGFSGAVGQLQMKARLDPQTVQSGEAATLEIRLQGTGHLQGLPAPRIDPPDGIEVFAPQGQNQEKVHGGRVEGERVWSFPVVAKQPGSWSLKVPPFTYFDPVRDRYETLPAHQLALTATHTGTSDTAEPSKSTSKAPPEQERSADEVPTGARRTEIWIAVAALLIGASLGLWMRRRSRSGDRRQTKKDQFKRQLLPVKQLHRPRDVARELEARWREWLVQSVSLPEDLEPERWSDHLRERGLDNSICERMRHVTADLHYLRYAPELAAVDTLRDDLIERSTALARDLAH